MTYSRTIESFGNIGNVTENDSTFLAAFSYLKSEGGILELKPNTIYNISKRLVVNNGKNFKIKGNNSTIKIDSSTPIQNQTQAITIVKSNNFQIEDLVIDGNMSGRGAYTSSTFSHLISIAQCSNVTFENIKTYNSPCDGVYIGCYDNNDINSICKIIYLNNVSCINSARNGLTLTAAHGVWINGGVYANNLKEDPGAGICIEGNDVMTFSPSCHGVWINNVSLRKNKLGIQVSNKAGSNDIFITQPHCVDNLIHDLLIVPSVNIIGGIYRVNDSFMDQDRSIRVYYLDESNSVIIAPHFIGRKSGALTCGKKNGLLKVIGAKFENTKRGMSWDESEVIDIVHSKDINKI